MYSRQSMDYLLEKYDIPYTPCTNVEQIKHIIKWIRAGKFKGRYETLVLDSVSFLSTLLLAEFRNDTAKYTNNGQKHYGLLKENVTDLLQEMFAANVHVYVTAWQAEKIRRFRCYDWRVSYDGRSSTTIVFSSLF